jgi:hypothetical protein
MDGRKRTSSATELPPQPSRLARAFSSFVRSNPKPKKVAPAAPRSTNSQEAPPSQSRSTRSKSLADMEKGDRAKLSSDNRLEDQVESEDKNLNENSTEQRDALIKQIEIMLEQLRAPKATIHQHLQDLVYKGCSREEEKTLLEYYSKQILQEKFKKKDTDLNKAVNAAVDKRTSLLSPSSGFISKIDNFQIELYAIQQEPSIQQAEEGLKDQKAALPMLLGLINKESELSLKYITALRQHHERFCQDLRKKAQVERDTVHSKLDALERFLKKSKVEEFWQVSKLADHLNDFNKVRQLANNACVQFKIVFGESSSAAESLHRRWARLDSEAALLVKKIETEQRPKLEYGKKNSQDQQPAVVQEFKEPDYRGQLRELLKNAIYDNQNYWQAQVKWASLGGGNVLKVNGIPISGKVIPDGLVEIYVALKDRELEDVVQIALARVTLKKNSCCSRYNFFGWSVREDVTHQFYQSVSVLDLKNINANTISNLDEKFKAYRSKLDATSPSPKPQRRL